MQGRLQEINGLRGLAILAVVWHHIVWAVLPNGAPALFGYSTYLILANGWIGVNLFFVLSGFVLYLPYATGKRQFQARSDVGEFYKHRFFRLAPAYYLSLVVILAFTYKTADYSGRYLFSLMTATYVFSPDWFSPKVNWALWSIGTEAVFSLVLPLLVVLIKRYGIGRVTAAMVAFALITRIVTRLMIPLHYGPDWIQDALLAGRIDEFALGMLVAKLYVDGKLPRPGVHLLVGAVALILAALYLHTAVHAGMAPALAMPFVNNVLDAGLILLLIHAIGGKSISAHVLSFRPLQVAGMACYSLYLWHYPLVEALGIHQGTATTGGLIMFAGSLLLLSGMTYRYVEFRVVSDWRQLFLIKSNKSARQPATAL